MRKCYLLGVLRRESVDRRESSGPPAKSDEQAVAHPGYPLFMAENTKFEMWIKPIQPDSRRPTLLFQDGQVLAAPLIARRADLQKELRVENSVRADCVGPIGRTLQHCRTCPIYRVTDDGDGLGSAS